MTTCFIFLNLIRFYKCLIKKHFDRKIFFKLKNGGQFSTFWKNGWIILIAGSTTFQVFSFCVASVYTDNAIFETNDRPVKEGRAFKNIILKYCFKKKNILNNFSRPNFSLTICLLWSENCPKKAVVWNSFVFVSCRVFLTY